MRGRSPNRIGISFYHSYIRPAALTLMASEVVSLESETFWALFQDTGDPLCYLLYKAVMTEENEPAEDALRPA